MVCRKTRCPKLCLSLNNSNQPTLMMAISFAYLCSSIEIYPCAKKVHASCIAPASPDSHTPNHLSMILTIPQVEVIQIFWALCCVLHSCTSIGYTIRQKWQLAILCVVKKRPDF